MKEVKQQIVDIKNEFFRLLGKVKTEDALAELGIRFLGRKSEFNALLKGLKDLSPEDRKVIGPLANSVKQEMSRALEEKYQKLKLASVDWEKDRLDVTAPGEVLPQGHLHILTQVQKEIEDIFVSMGFDVASGPEVETEFYNFDALNVPANHPARDMQDTFWVKKENPESEQMVLRTQTSAVQVRYMEKHIPPFRMMVTGKVFRNEATDTTHEHTFHQFEALMVGDDVNVGNLKYIAQEFFSRFFKTEVKIRLRPSYFPFVEPGFEFDISCTSCNGDGCSACRNNGWLEIGGAGMVNQNVFEAAGYKRNQYQGFAWGFGLERLAMMKHGISDIRLFHGGDIRFLSQF